MAGYLQSYQIKQQTNRNVPFPHYKNKPSAHGFNIIPERSITLNYIDPYSALPNSEFETLLLNMLIHEGSFVEEADLNQVPISLSAQKTPKTPLSWTATYLFPTDDIEAFINDNFTSNTETPKYDSVGILSWSISASIENQSFGIQNEFKGYQFGYATISINATCDFEIEDIYDLDSILTEGLDLNINVYTLQAEKSISEDTSLRTVYQYTWVFGVI